MITRISAFTTSDGKTVATLEEAQKHELALLIAGDTGSGTRTEDDEVIDKILANKDKVIDILTTTPRSKAKARSVNGGRKNRTPKTTPVDRAGSPTVEKA